MKCLQLELRLLMLLCLWLMCTYKQNFTDGNSSHGDKLEVICSEDFFFDDGACTPECGQWSIYSSELKSAVKVLVILSLATGIIGGTTVVVISLIRHEKM